MCDVMSTSESKNVGRVFFSMILLLTFLHLLASLFPPPRPIQLGSLAYKFVLSKTEDNSG